MTTDNADERVHVTSATISPGTTTPSLRRFSSEALLQGERQVVIEHAGREYRLRLTAQGKLILTA